MCTQKKYPLHLLFLVVPRSMQDLSFSTRDQTHTLYRGSRVLTTGLPGKSFRYISYVPCSGTHPPQPTYIKTPNPSCCCYLVAKLCPALCDPLDCSPRDFPGKNTGSRLPFPSSRGSAPPRDQTHVSCLGRQILYF